MPTWLSGLNCLNGNLMGELLFTAQQELCSSAKQKYNPMFTLEEHILYADVVQWQNAVLVRLKSRVQFPSSAHKMTRLCTFPKRDASE